MLTPEGRIKKLIKIWLKEQGAYVFSPVQTGRGARTLDLLVCWKGLFVGIEVKAPGKVATMLQARIMADMHDADGQAFCVDSLDACINEFERIDEDG